MLSIDCGSSSIKIAHVEKKIKLLKLDRQLSFSRSELSEFFAELKVKFGKFALIRVTGGKSMILPDKFGEITLEKVSELEAICRGALYLAKLQEALIVNLGTGTTVLYAKKKTANLSFTHLGGLALGGGTILGLAKLLLQTTSWQQIEKLASKGDWQKADFTIGEITGSKLSDKLPLDKSAAHFAKVGREGCQQTKADLAAAILNMVATSLASYLFVCSQKTMTQRIILTGGLSKSEAFVNLLKSFAKNTGCKFYLPENAEFATVVGGALRG